MGSSGTVRRTGRGVQVALAGVLGWLLALAVLLLIERRRLELVLRALGGGGSRLGADDLLAAVVVVVAPLLAGIAIALLVGLLLHVLRTLLYARAMHTYAGQYLQQHGILQRYGLAPSVVRFSSAGEPTTEGSELFPRVAEAHARVLLLGEAGTGKTVALHALAYELTRRRWLVSCLLGRRPLPVLVPLPGYAEAAPGVARHQYLASQVARFGSHRFARSSLEALRAQRLVLLCDELDAVHAATRSAVCAELADLGVAGQPPVRTIIACDLQTYVHAPQAFAPVRSFQRVVLADMPAATAAVRRAMRSPTRGKQIASPLEGHRLETALATPALLAALLTLLEAGWEPPYGRGPLLIEYVTFLCERATKLEPGVEGGNLGMLLGELAGSLREADYPAVAVNAGVSVGAAVGTWLGAHPPIAVNDHRSATRGPSARENVEVLCRAALKAGILVVRSDGRAVQFAHRLLEAGFAAWWLQQDDDGMGRIQPALLRPRWALPVVVWSDGGKDPADVAKRLLRLADTPDGTAARVGRMSGASVYPAALALAVAAAAEGFANALAQPAETPRLTQRMRDLTQQHLRDMLDQALIYMSDHDHQARLTRALQQVEEATGPELSASIAYLIRQDEFNRLLRAQLVGLLGMLASPPALAVLIELLGEMDPVMRQATEQAFRLAGSAALGPLQSALADESDMVRARAGEVLARLGDIAVDNAIAGLGSESPPERAASARALGQLRATQAVEALIARLDDDASDVRAVAARALGTIGGGQAAEALLEATRSTDPTLRAAAAGALGTCREARPSTRLLELLNDPEAEVRAAAAESLGKLGDERAVEALRERREDPDPWAQHAVSTALRRMGRS